MERPSGWLIRRGPFGECRRWCVLDAEQQELLLRREPHSRRPVAAIRLGDIAAIDAAGLESSGSFDLVPPSGRPWRFRAEPAAEAGAWVAALRPMVPADRPAERRRTRKWRTASSLSSAEPLLAGAQPAVARGAARGPDASTPAVPWCVETVWQGDSESNAPLEIVADLGSWADLCSVINVMLSDGTTMPLDVEELKLSEGGWKEVAVAGPSALHARLERSAAGASATAAAALRVCWASCLLGATVGASLWQGLALLMDEPVAWLVPVMWLVALAAAGAAALPALQRWQWRPRCGCGAAAGAEGAGAEGAGVELRLKATCRSAPSAGGAPRCGAEGAGRRGLPGFCRRLPLPRKPLAPLARLRLPPSRSAGRPQMRSPSSSCSPTRPPADGVPWRKPAVTTSPAPSPAPSAAPSDDDGPAPPEGAAMFTGRWRLNLQRSDDPSEMLKAMSVPWAARAAVARYARVVEIQQEGLRWTETMITPVVKKTVVMTLDGTPHVEMSPVDKSTLTMRSRYSEDGKEVVTRSESSDGTRSQVVARRLLEDGRVYYTVNTLRVAGGKEYVTNNYFDRVE